MGRAQSSNNNTAPTQPVAVRSVDPDFEKGLALGSRNGKILVDRVKQRTTDVLGCDGIEDLQSALVKVTRSLKAPVGADSMVAGFYSGYLREVRKTLREVRNGCSELVFSSGEFAGQLIGAVACQTTSIELTVLSELELGPLYSGWSGGSEEVQLSCQTALSTTVSACTDGAEISTEVSAILSVGCSDQSESL